MIRYQRSEKMKARLDGAVAGIEELKMLKDIQTARIKETRIQLEENKRRRNSLDPGLIQFMQRESLPVVDDSEEETQETPPIPRLNTVPNHLCQAVCVNNVKGNKKKKVTTQITPTNFLHPRISSIKAEPGTPAQVDPRLKKRNSLCITPQNFVPKSSLRRRSSIASEWDLDPRHNKTFMKPYSMPGLSGCKSIFTYPSPMHAILLQSDKAVVSDNEDVQTECDNKLKNEETFQNRKVENPLNRRRYSAGNCLPKPVVPPNFRRNIFKSEQTVSETCIDRVDGPEADNEKQCDRVDEKLSDLNVSSENIRNYPSSHQIPENQIGINSDENKLKVNVSRSSLRSDCDRDSAYTGSCVSLLTISSTASGRQNTLSLPPEDGYGSRTTSPKLMPRALLNENKRNSKDLSFSAASEQSSCDQSFLSDGQRNSRDLSFMTESAYLGGDEQSEDEYATSDSTIKSNNSSDNLKSISKVGSAKLSDVRDISSNKLYINLPTKRDNELMITDKKQIDEIGHHDETFFKKLPKSETETKIQNDKMCFKKPFVSKTVTGIHVSKKEEIYAVPKRSRPSLNPRPRSLDCSETSISTSKHFQDDEYLDIELMKRFSKQNDKRISNVKQDIVSERSQKLETCSSLELPPPYSAHYDKHRDTQTQNNRNVNFKSCTHNRESLLSTSSRGSSPIIFNKDVDNLTETLV